MRRGTLNYYNLSYNQNLKQRAKLLRKSGNLPEVILWSRIKNKQFKGIDIDRQKIIGNKIVDFYCARYKVIIEIDGVSHNEKLLYDKKRDEYFQSIGLKVIHISVKDIMYHLDDVLDFLFHHSYFT